MPSESRSKFNLVLVFTGPGLGHSPVLGKAAALADARREFLSEAEVLARYGARTSGQALLFDATGKLMFSGGLTESRGVSGDSVGMLAIRNVIEGRQCVGSAPVYGCALQTPKVTS